MLSIEALAAFAYNNSCRANNSLYRIVPDLHKYQAALDDNESRHVEPIKGYIFATPVVIEPWTRTTSLEQLLAAYQHLAQAYSPACYERNITWIPEDQLERCLEYGALVTTPVINSADSVCAVEDRRAMVRAERGLLPAWNEFTRAMMSMRPTRLPVEGIILCAFVPRTSIREWEQLCTKFAAPGFHFFICPQ